MTIDQLAEEVREQNRLYEAGETDRAFWLAQQNRLKAMRELGATQTQTADLVGKSQRWVQTVLAWDYSSTNNPDWGNKSQAERSANTTRKVLRDPTQRQQVIDSLTSDERVQVARSVIKEPEVLADPVVRQATEDQEAKAARKRISDARKASLLGRATPLSQFFWRIITQMQNWTRDLRVIGEELGSLQPDQREQVIEAHKRLLTQVEHNLEALGVLEATVPDAIEGNARDATVHQLSRPA